MTTSIKLHIGDRPVLVTTFTDENGDPATPTTVTGSVLRPDGTVTELTPIPDGATFRTELPILDQPRVWSWRIVGTGTVAAADEGSFNVSTSRFPA